jgi:hypothetical protein
MWPPAPARQPSGKHIRRPIVSTFAIFLDLKATDQVRNIICYNHLPVIPAGNYAGITDSVDRAAAFGYDGVELALLRAEGLDIVKEAAGKSVRLMPDLFHRNIEDASFRAAFESARGYVGDLHVAGSKRLAPGRGHMPLDEIFQIFGDIGYDGYLTVEMLPKPEPDQTAAQAARYLLGKLNLKRDVSRRPT